MNINNGKTGIIDIPGALHSTGGDGDNQIGGVVAYTGDIWDETQGKNQAEINATINNVSNLPLTSINGHVGSFKNIPKEDSNVVEADETIALGVGVYGDKQRSFGWGSEYQTLWLTGSNSQYTVIFGNSSGFIGDKPLEALATAWIGGYILTSGTTHTRAAKVIDSDFTDGVLTITTDTNLGALNEVKYTYESKTGQQNFCIGGFINSGRQNIAIGTSNFVASNNSVTMGEMNGSTENATDSTTIGAWNNNDSLGGTIIGENNTLKTEDSTIVGTSNSITSDSNTPSSVLGYNNNIPSGYGALIGNDNTSSGDKGYALGEHNNLQYSGVALGQYNKDYTSNSDSKKNLFVVGNGTADNARSNSIEQKQDGTLFIKGVGNFDGTNSNVNTTKSLQGVLNEKADNVTVSAALNDLSDKTDNLNEDIEDLEKTTSSSLNDLNEKVDNLNDEVNDNEKTTASALADLDDKCIQKDEDGNVIILKIKLDVSKPPRQINERIKIQFIDDIDLFVSQYIKLLKIIYESEISNLPADLVNEFWNGQEQSIREGQENYKLFIINNDKYKNLIISEIYDANNNLVEEVEGEIPGLIMIPKESSIVANTDYYLNSFHVIDEEFITIFDLKRSGKLYLQGVGNYGESNSNEESDEESSENSENPKSVQEVIFDLKNNLQNLNLDFKNNLKIDSQGNLVVHEIGTYEKETHGSSGFHLSDDYEKIYTALTYDPDSSTTPQLDVYTQEELKQKLVQDNLINPDYYYYVVVNYDGSPYLAGDSFYNPNNIDGFSKFVRIRMNDDYVEFSDYIEKRNNDDIIAYIVIGLETEFSGDLSNVLLMYDHYPKFDKYISKINLNDGKLYLPGIGNYTPKNPSYNGILSLLEVIANLTSRIETLENQLNGGNS